MTEAKRLLNAATPLPWYELATGSEGFSIMPPQSIRGRVARVADRAFHEDKANAVLIVYAVNRLPDYEAAVEALERLVRAHDERFAPTPDIMDAARAALRRLRDTERPPVQGRVAEARPSPDGRSVSPGLPLRTGAE